MWGLLLNHPRVDLCMDLIELTLWLMKESSSGFPWGSCQAKPACSLTPGLQAGSPSLFPWGAWTLLLAPGFHNHRNSGLPDPAHHYLGEKIMKCILCFCNPLYNLINTTCSLWPSLPTVPLQKRYSDLFLFPVPLRPGCCLDLIVLWGWFGNFKHRCLDFTLD